VFSEIGRPPSGGCVLKRHGWAGVGGLDGQPPSGGCVLKRRQKCR